MNGEIGIDIHTLCIKHIANENLPKAQEEKKEGTICSKDIY